jgi:UDP-glucose 6-dehydrogenase
MNITVVGTGYVGLVSGARFADFGHTVTCVDMDNARVRAADFTCTGIGRAFALRNGVFA